MFDFNLQPDRVALSTTGEHDMWNQILEDAIVGKLISTLVDEGYRLEISDQDGGGLFIYAAPNGRKQPKDGYKYWVRLVPGNGTDILVDYTTNLEDTLKPVQDFIARFEGA